MRELSLHLLDIAENSISAGAKSIKIIISEDTVADLLQMSISDNGRGMSSEMVREVIDPFTTTRTTRKVGLGIPLLKAAAEACNGSLEITSELGVGTQVEVQLSRNHIDRMPIGDLITTLLNLLVSNPQVHWIFEYRFDGISSVFDDEAVKQELGDLPMSEPGILACLRNMIEATIFDVNPNFSQDTVTILS